MNVRIPDFNSFMDGFVHEVCKGECLVNDSVQPMCCADFDGWWCTRRAGHDGQHVACAGIKHATATWGESK